MQTRWAQTDAGWSLDTSLGPLWVSCLARGDDVLAFAMSEVNFTRMLSECGVEFGNIGLEVALGKKTLWSSSVDNTGRSLIVSGVSLSWSSSLEFSGHVFDFCGHIGKSAEHRQHKANGVFRRWAPLLLNESLLHERTEAFLVSVAASALWLASCWTLTKTVQQVGLVVCSPAVSNGLVQAKAR